ncbi:hypothetical protein G4228_020337 [Cervus hanglu yarkandensis]|uniref:Beta/alpha-defensin C-terminal domain-containing protein n=1 Tax=Cervus hanglu yarkandensis TaxID=84702 RepID=A0A833SR94_9CERV|nr:hypothetical protein G4228_020337 [Cervus hanglu yarkandensis]
MRLHHLLLALLFVVLSAESGIRNSLSCRLNFGICLPNGCPGSMREIGTCFEFGVKCCRGW